MTKINGEDLHVCVHGLVHSGRKLSQTKRSCKNTGSCQSKHGGTDQGGKEKMWPLFFCSLKTLTHWNHSSLTDSDAQCTSRPEERSLSSLYCVTSRAVFVLTGVLCMNHNFLRWYLIHFTLVGLIWETNKDAVSVKRVIGRVVGRWNGKRYASAACLAFSSCLRACVFHLEIRTSLHRFVFHFRFRNKIPWS